MQSKSLSEFNPNLPSLAVLPQNLARSILSTSASWAGSQSDQILALFVATLG